MTKRHAIGGIIALICATLHAQIPEREAGLKVKGLVISVSFKDTKPEYVHPARDVDALFNDPNYAKYPGNVAKNTGSLWQYFHEVSNGKFDLKHDVVAYKARHPEEYYLHANVRGKRVQELLDEALLQLRDVEKYDFSKLSLSDKGEIIELAIFYVANANPREDNFIPGFAGGHPKDYGSFKTRRFHIVPQRNFFKLPDGRRPLVLRTLAHEAAHAVLGWPDLYDIDGSSRGLGMMGLMSGTGDYENPLLPECYCLALQGWVPVVDITNDAPGTMHRVTGDGQTIYRYSHPTNPREYFLIDACHKASRKDHRFNSGKDGMLPHEGLRIWHVDEDGINSCEAMTPTGHYKVSLEQADGQFHLERNKSPGDGKDYFYAGNATEFNDSTTPNAKWWDGSESGLVITKVSPIGPGMTFTTHHNKLPFFVNNGRTYRLNLPQGHIHVPDLKYIVTNTQARKSLSWSAKSNVAWLMVSPISGALGEKTGRTITAQFNMNVLNQRKPGKYSGTISIQVGDKLVRRRVELTVDRPRLVHHWPLDETKGRAASNKVSLAVPAKLKRKTFAGNSVPGHIGRAIKIDGLETLSAEMEGWPTNTITLTAWVKPTNKPIPRRQTLLGFPSERAQIFLDGNGYIRYGWGTGQWGAAKLSLKKDEWTLIALVIDRDTATIATCEPGGDVRSKMFKRRKHAVLELTHFCMGGASHKDSFLGHMDDVRIFNYPLADADLKSLANGTLTTGKIR